MLDLHDWLPKARLWLVLDRHAAQPRSLDEAARMCIAGGIDAVVCRVKDLPQEEVRALAIPVRQACEKTRTPFVMSHDIELAQELQADAIQLGVGDPPIAEVRGVLGQGVAIGYSTHSVDEAAARHADGVDYVFLGPIFPTPAKLKYGSPLGIDVVSAGMNQLNKPVVFIGGITPVNLPDVLEAGGQRVAAIAALQARPDPQAAAAQFRNLLDGYQTAT